MLTKKIATLSKILNDGIIAVVRAETVDQAIKISQALKSGGINIIEITMTVPGALKAIEELTNIFKEDEDMLLGAGTILDSETTRLAILAGAEFIVTPHLNQEVIRTCNRYQKVVMPGAMTVKEIVEAYENGVDIIKIFPSNILGPEFIKALKGPLPHASFCPTGGVNLENITEWIGVGAVCVGVGGELTKGAKNADYTAVSEMAKKYVEKIKHARG